MTQLKPSVHQTVGPTRAAHTHGVSVVQGMLSMPILSR